MDKIQWGWFTPVDGDADHVGTLYPEVQPSIDYIIDTIRTAEDSGFNTVLIPTSFINSLFSEEAPRAETIAVTSALAVTTTRIRLLMAVKIGEVHPPLLAKMCATLDEMSRGRLELNVTSGGGSIESRYGEKLDHDSRYERTWETLKLMKMLWTQERTTFQGKYVSVDDVVCEPKPVQKPYPPLFMVGTSEMARRISAEEADVHLFQGDLPERIKINVDDLRGRAERVGRTLRFAVRLQVVVRETEEKAWAAVRDMMAQVDPRVVAARSSNRAGDTGIEHKALIEKALSGDSMMAPNIWGGLHAVKGGAGTVLVGNPDQLTNRIMDYVNVGVSTFILSSYPMKREAKRVGEMLMPRVGERMKVIA